MRFQDTTQVVFQPRLNWMGSTPSECIHQDIVVNELDSWSSYPRVEKIKVVIES